MRVIFAGTPAFARTALAALVAAGHEVVLVLAQPDRPSGRGLKLQAGAVSQFAAGHALPLLQPRSLRLDGKFPQDAALAQAAMTQSNADVMVVAAYGLMLPPWVLNLPRLGCLNIHASVLPRWRGAAPIHRAIEAGDTHTGVTIMQMDAGLDTGDMLLVETLPILAQDNTGSLHDKLAALGACLAVRALDLAQAGALRAVPQPGEGARYARKVDKNEAWMDWSLAAQVLERRVRAFNPFPGASTELATEVIKVWSAQAMPDQAPADTPVGTVLSVTEAGIDVATGDGLLRLCELQRAGGRRMQHADFARGFLLTKGMQFGGAAQLDRSGGI